MELRQNRNGAEDVDAVVGSRRVPNTQHAALDEAAATGGLLVFERVVDCVNGDRGTLTVDARRHLPPVMLTGESLHADGTVEPLPR